MKYNDNGTLKDIYVKAFDTLPIGTEVDYDGNTVPDGWTQVSDNRVVLYENATGTDSEITLSDNYSNYSYIEVYYGWNADNTFPYGCMCTKIDLASTSKVLISYNLGGSNWYINLYECWSLNNDNKLTRVERFQHNQSGYSTNTQTKITKVIGYK